MNRRGKFFCKFLVILHKNGRIGRFLFRINTPGRKDT